MSNVNLSTNISEGNNMTNEQLMQQLVNNFISGDGSPRFTDFDRFLNALSREVAKPLFGHSGKSAGGSSWRDEVKARFANRGAKWVFVSLEEIRPTLDRLAAEGIDIEDYDRYTQAHGQAWIRFSGGRMNDGKQCAAFEVRTGGAKDNHTTQLHYIALDELDEKITLMNSTPHSMKLEADETQEDVAIAEPEEAVEVDVAPEEVIDEVDECEDIMGDIEDMFDDEDLDSAF